VKFAMGIFGKILSNICKSSFLTLQRGGI